MQLGILGRPDGWHVRRIATEAAARGHQAVTVRWESLQAAVGPHGENLGPSSIVPLDMLVVRGMPAAGLRQLPGGGLEEVIFRMNVLTRMEQAGLSVVNPPRALEIAIDKYLSLAMIAERGLAVPETFVAQDDGAIREAWDRLGRDAVVKPIFGSRGRGLVRIHEAEALEQLLVARTAGSPLYLQEFIPHVGWDLRVFLAGDRHVAARRRSDDWRTNTSLGGRLEPFDPPAGVIDLARAAAAAVGTPLAGVDLLPAADGRLVVLECNGVPGWRRLEETVAAHATAMVVDFLEGPQHTHAAANQRLGRPGGAATSDPPDQPCHTGQTARTPGK